MRTTGILLAALLILAGCIRTVHDEQLESFSTGCARSDEVVDTRSEDANLPAETLHLKYSSSGLVVIQNNGHYNCYINVTGLDITSSVEGNKVLVTAYVEPLMKCICPVKTVQAVVPGVETGKEYILYFNQYSPVQFKYSKSLDIIVEPIDPSLL